MEQSASPLFILMIACIVTLAMGVHAVSAGDPSYGSDVDLTAPATSAADPVPASDL